MKKKFKNYSIIFYSYRLENLVKKFLKDKYGIQAEIQQLEGYSVINYKVSVKGESKYLLKLTGNLQEKAFLKIQDLIYIHLKGLEDYSFPQTVFGLDGKHIYLFTDNEGNQYLAHMLSYIKGSFLAKDEKSSELLQNLGKFLGTVNKHLLNFNHPVIQARHFKWDLQYFLEFYSNPDYVKDPEKRKLIEYYLQQFKENVLPVLPGLRKSTIHSDANDWNVLSNGKKITGIIDFGDVVFSPSINELAIAVSYMGLGSEDPLSNISEVIKGYHQKFPIEEKELNILYYLIAARLCTSICQSTKSSLKDPDNKYISIQEEQIWDLLIKWIQISPDKARIIFYKVCNLKNETRRLKASLYENRIKYVGKSLSVSYKDPITMERAAFQYMFDKDGKTYVDCVNNIMHVGHCHPKVVHAGQTQMAKLNTNTRYLYDELNNYAKGITSRFPYPLNKVFFVNSGSAASDLALRLARNFTNKKDMIVLDHGYHGNTASTIEASPYKFNSKGGDGPEDYIHIAPIPDGYHGRYKSADANAGHKYAELIRKYLNDKNAGFICEPIVGCGGQVMLPPGYLKEIYSMVREQGGLCISDEVQTGFGRVGTHFWGYEIHNVIPDIVILGKPIGNGHPIGAVITTDEIANAFDNGMEFFSSFGGNPVSCAIGNAVLEVIDEEKLQQNALDVGNYLINELSKLRNKYEIIGSVRGSGLYLGIELVNDLHSLQPATKEAVKLVNQLKEKGFLLSTDGPYNNVIKIKPPLCFTCKNAEDLISAISDSLKVMDK